MTSDVTLTGAATSAQRTQNQSVSLGQDFSQFLNLLTTQLKHQDPLNPMDSSEFTNQLVQFSQVEQSINTNQKLDNLVNLQINNGLSYSLGYVGKDITYASAEMNFDGTAPINVNYGMSTTAMSAIANIYDEKGNLVYSKSVEKDEGPQKFTWNGDTMSGDKAEPGTYSIEISAFDSESNPIEVSTAVSGYVRGVETQNGVINLLVGDRAVPLNNVINAIEPPRQTTQS